MYEWIGYAASVLIAISITIRGGVYFRIFNLSGAVVFFIYSLLIKALPITLINAYSICINVFHLIRKDKKPIDKKPENEEKPD